MSGRSAVQRKVMPWKSSWSRRESVARLEVGSRAWILFLKCGRQLWALEDYWRQVDIATGHSASIADFTWSPAHILLVKFGFSSRFFCNCGDFILWSTCGHLDYRMPVILVLLRIGRMLCLCLTVFLFQGLLRHCFICLLIHVAVVLGREKVYSLKFTTTSVPRGLNFRFWAGKELLTMTIAHCGPDVPSVQSSVLLCSQVLSAISSEPTIICCAGGSPNFNKALDKTPNRKSGLQYPFNLLLLQIEKLMHKQSFIVMGKIDMFSMIWTLLVRLSGLLDEKWTQSINSSVRWDSSDEMFWSE